MPYLVGVLQRSDYSFSDNAMNEAHISNVIEKQDLIKAKQDENYQVINLATQEFYNPENNNWEKFKVK